MKSVPCSLLASGSFFKSRKVMDWKDDLLDGKIWNKLFKTGQVFAFQIRNWNKLLKSPHISPGNALLYCNFVVLMIFTEKLIYWIKKFFKFAVLEHDQCVWTQVSNFTGILLANWFFGVLSCLGTFPDTSACMVLCSKILFSFLFCKRKSLWAQTKG